MIVNKVINSVRKNTTLGVYWITVACVVLGILLIAVPISAGFLDHFLKLANIPPVFTSWAGKCTLPLTWLIAVIKWWKRRKNEILRISQLTPEEYENDILKRENATESRNNKIFLLLVVGFILYLIGKSEVGHSIINMLYAAINALIEIISKSLNYNTLICVVAFYVFCSVIQSLNRISNNIYHGITEIKEKLDIIIGQTE